MSDIPKAREIIETLLERAELSTFVRKNLNLAYSLMTREAPKFVSRIEHPPLTKEQVLEIKMLRDRGWSLNRIAEHMGTNIGRVSEAVNGLREGV